MVVNRVKHDNVYLDLPPYRDDIEDNWKATQDALGIRPRLGDESLGTGRWDNIPRTGRIYWYRGVGFGRNTGTA